MSEAYNYSLAHALLQSRLWPYMGYRTRLFFINNLLKIILHIAEFYFIYLFFSPPLFHQLIIFRSITFILYGGWWGSLELLREHGRIARYSNHLNLLGVTVIYWLILTIGLLLLIDAGSIAWTIHHWSHIDPIYSASFHFYWFAILAQINLAFIASVLHSGIYGISRVYRPLFSLLLSSLVSFVIMFLGWLIIGIYALPIAFISGALLSVLFSLHYTLNMYALFKINLKANLHLQGLKHFLHQTLHREFFLSGTAGILMTASGPLLITFSLFFRLQDWDYLSFLYLYMIIPILQLNSEWTYLFYFDLKRLFPKPFLLLLKRFQRHAFYFSIIITFFAWLLAGLACLSYVGHWWIAAWLLLPWFALRSMLAYLQMDAFVRRFYWDVIFSGIFVVVSLVPFLDTRIHLAYSLVGLFIALAISIVWLLHRHSAGHRHLSTTDIIEPYFSWLHKAKSQKKPLVLCKIELVPYIRFRQVLTIVKLINRNSTQPFIFTQINSYTLVGYQLTTLKPLDTSPFLLAGAGLIEAIKLIQPSPATLSQALIDFLGIIPQENTKTDIIAYFKQQFPHALVYSLHDDSLPDDLSAAAFSGLRKYIERPWAINFYQKKSISALLERSIATVLFVIDLEKENREQAREWLAWITAKNSS